MLKKLMKFASKFVVSREKLAILTYHRVLGERDSLRTFDLAVDEFREQMRWISGAFNVLPLPDAVSRMRKGVCPSPAVVITFDDGYRDNVEVAYCFRLSQRWHDVERRNN